VPPGRGVDGVFIAVPFASSCLGWYLLTACTMIGELLPFGK
jgi:hypothetical protein